MAQPNRETDSTIAARARSERMSLGRHRRLADRVGAAGVVSGCLMGTEVSASWPIALPENVRQSPWVVAAAGAIGLAGAIGIVKSTQYTHDIKLVDRILQAPAPQLPPGFLARTTARMLRWTANRLVPQTLAPEAPAPQMSELISVPAGFTFREVNVTPAAPIEQVYGADPWGMGTAPVSTE